MGALREFGMFLVATSFIWLPALIYVGVRLVKSMREDRARTARLERQWKEARQ